MITLKNITIANLNIVSRYNLGIGRNDDGDRRDSGRGRQRSIDRV